MSMIGFNALGKLGRLGNQMFQFASLKGIAKNNNYNFCLPPSEDKDEWTDHQLFVPFKFQNVMLLNIQYIDGNRPTVEEKSFAFDEELYNNCPKWVNLQGYFQSEKYFKNIEDDIRNDFQFHDHIYNPAKKMVDSVDNPISLHIRRTDYLTLSNNHNNLGLEYYEEALKHFDNDRTVIIFSDDPEWCNQQEIFSGDRFLVSENNSNYVDLCLMTLCKDHIIANSSFSWWGAWLAKGNKVIAPSKWFGPDNAHLDTTDLYCSDWIVI
jgi:hypothetical protein